MKATELLKKQHKDVKSLFREVKKPGATERRRLMDEITDKLQHHMKIEEDIFYPAVRQLDTKKTDEMIPEAYEEHHVVKLVLGELPDLDPEDEAFEAKMTVLSELIDHHVEEEEEEMFKAAQKLGDERLTELGAEMEPSSSVDTSATRAKKLTAKKAVAAMAVVLAFALGAQRASAESTAADNSGKNVRDRGGETLTPGDQSASEPDTNVTREIRKAIVADKHLSTNAHNVKIITTDGVVTLRGPVKTAKEKSTIAATAKQYAGTNRVDNQLEVASH